MTVITFQDDTQDDRMCFKGYKSFIKVCCKCTFILPPRHFVNIYHYQISEDKRRGGDRSLSCLWTPAPAQLPGAECQGRLSRLWSEEEAGRDKVQLPDIYLG